MMTLGERIAQLRREAGLSQEGLAEQMGVSRQAVSKWEKGLSYPDTENLLALAALFGVSADHLAGLRREEEQSGAKMEEEMAAPPEPPRQRRRVWPYVLLAVVLSVVIGLGPYLALLMLNAQEPSIDSPATLPVEPEGVEQPAEKPAAEDIGEFALIWQGREGREFLRAGEQTGAFPFGTLLRAVELETVTDTDYSAVKLHEVSCGALRLSYTVDSGADASYLLEVSTILSGYETPRGIEVGSSEGLVLSKYGDALVYCLKDSGEVRCKHDYYYAYAPEDAFGTAVLFYIDGGKVSGLTVRAGDDRGNEAFQVDRTNIFPVVNGQVDFTGREEPERETLNAAKAVYVALSALLADQNLSAEEVYRHRQTIYENLPLLDWQAFAALGPAGEDSETKQSLLQYLESQTALSTHEISSLQGGAFRMDGAYATWYSILLGKAFLAAPEQYVRCMVDANRPYREDQLLVLTTAYGCEEGQILPEAAEAARELCFHSGALRTEQEKRRAMEIYEEIQKMMGTNQ